MNREYHKWHSPHLERDMELLVFGHTGARVIVFPTRDGRFFDYENWKMVEALREKIVKGYIQLYCVDSHDRFSLYANWMRPEDRMKRHLDFERYILDEVIPFTRDRNPHPSLIAHGCSLGGYHAMNIGLRHPERFDKIVALSGRFDLTQPIGTFRGLFDGYYDDLIYFNNPSHFVPLIEDESLLQRLRKLTIVFVTGDSDVFLANNRAFSRALWQKKIPHTFAVWEGEAHRPRQWRQMVRLYL
ncbi:MAG: alpha/beta fold hydrolase [Capsulimonadales bacterium]|nr:alpha/beta fold hydrolase [Capsulimonadales bacterium]